MKIVLSLILSISILLFAVGCGEVSYSKEKVRETVIKLCREEYNMDVDVELIGNTLYLYLPIQRFFDLPSGRINEKAQEKIMAAMLIARRTAYSSDADIQFYCIIVQDANLPQVQFVLIKYVWDIKYLQFMHISFEEASKRTLQGSNINPQYQKEQAIIDVFGKMKLDSDTQEKVLDDFFRSQPSSIEGIGYWKGQFYAKDITLKEFLAEQMARRIKLRFDKEPLIKYSLKSITGKFIEDSKERFFSIAFRAEGLLFVYDPNQRKVMEDDIFENAFLEIKDVIIGYKFDNFDFVKIKELNYNKELIVPRENFYLFEKRKLPINAILEAMN